MSQTFQSEARTPDLRLGSLVADELGAIDDATEGTAVASKVLRLDANKDVAGVRNLGVTNLDAGRSGTAGSANVFPATASRGKLAALCANQDGNTTVTVTAMGMAQATAVNLPDPGAATSYLMQMSAENDRKMVDATPDEIDNACDVSARVQTMTASGAVTAGVQSLQLNNASATIAATIANANAHQGLFHVKAIAEPAGGQDHTVTLTAGTWNGSATVATFADINDALVVYFDSAGNGTVVVNVGTVAFTGP
jgi:hypothetical protein